ncbi:DUF1127 domain-containing protein [Pelagibacterium sp.]|uniref:DUF1127 domain-containing protein n=1 Tax=Pelagibacterium sp. TaxID=1967288 RepID=UPI003A93BA06
MTLIERNDLLEQDEFEGRPRYRAAIWRHFKAVISSWWRAGRVHANRRHSRIALAEMKDWQLRDIGINRGEVDTLLNRNGVARDRIIPLEVR